MTPVRREFKRYIGNLYDSYTTQFVRHLCVRRHKTENPAEFDKSDEGKNNIRFIISPHIGKRVVRRMFVRGSRAFVSNILLG